MPGPAPLFSIIIPFKEPGGLLREVLEHVRLLRGPEWEIVLLPDGPMAGFTPAEDAGARIFPSGRVSPAVKRDLGAAEARGEFLAFIDDDAYPEPDWLEVAQAALRAHPGAVAVGGPAMTPASDPFWARVSGAVYLSRFSGGFPERYLPRPPERTVDDWPSVNLIVRREAFLACGGFDSAYWPGEDTKLCQDLLARTGGEIRYLPGLKVWHHRRGGLRKHLRQVGNYGLHRGHFARVLPTNSRRVLFFIPSLWTLFLAVMLPAAFAFPAAASLLALGVAAYAAALGLAFIQIIRYESLLVALCAVPYTALTHLWYGIRFLRGLTLRQLTSSLGR